MWSLTRAHGTYGLLRVRKPKAPTVTGHATVQCVIIKSSSMAEAVQALTPSGWTEGVPPLYSVEQEVLLASRWACAL